mmetsp:Transcript_28435/g.52177  ORF Transcript_28435/g.52177 Transcript_28435/m.52177 type:complete len:144 (+) Transcript_28435:1713-2144(+)
MLPGKMASLSEVFALEAGAECPSGVPDVFCPGFSSSDDSGLPPMRLRSVLARGVRGKLAAPGATGAAAGLAGDIMTGLAGDIMPGLAGDIMIDDALLALVGGLLGTRRAKHGVIGDTTLADGGVPLASRAGSSGSVRSTGVSS